MPHATCPPEENVLRAIQTAHFDPERNRYSSALFKGSSTSVSRLSISSIDELFAVFHRELDCVIAAGEINVGTLQEIGRNFQSPVELTVLENPTDSNPAHAVIPQKISKGLARAIIRALRIHFDS